MVKGQNIVCIANMSWFGNYAKSTVQLLERLARHNKILFVEYPYTLKDVVSTWRGNQQAPVKRMLGLQSRLYQINTNSDTQVWNLVTPPSLPLYFLKNESLFQFLFKWNVLIYKRTLRKAMRKLDMEQPLVITAFNPIYGLSVLGKLHEKSHIYYCYDGVESGYYGSRIYDYEDRFSANVDAVITTSDFLNRQKMQLNDKSFVVKNGVDFPVFEKYAKSEVSLRKRKKVGYIGSLDHRFDIDTVEYVIAHLPDVDFEFVGDLRNQNSLERLRKFSNVSLKHAVTPNEVPPLMADCDAGIIPYMVNEVNKNIYPLKINEYMAVGVPVVMNAFADLPEFDTMVAVAHSKEEFVTKLKVEIETDSKTKISDRIAFASKNSWDARTEEMSMILQKFI